MAGGNEPDIHLRGVEPGRDFEPALGRRPRASRRATAAPTGGTIRIEPAIEVGNIFKLGTRYSEPLGATYLDEDGTEQPIWMGSYGIGPARIVAAAVEQFADEQGISWPRALAPFDVELVTLGKEGEEAREVAERLYEELRDAGLDVLYDDRGGQRRREVRRRRAARLPAAAHGGQARASRPGELDAQVRRGQEKRSLPLEGAADGGRGAVAEPPLTRQPPARPRPLRRPAAGDARAASRFTRGRSPTRSASSGSRCMPVFLVLALCRATAATRSAAVLFAVIAWGDYLDGMAARHHRPVQPPRRAARPAHRPAAGALRA